MKRLILINIFVVTAVSVAFAQIKSNLKEVEPFSIKRGSTFTASGGSPNAGSGNDASYSKPSGIASDILEAKKIISANFFGAKLRDSEITQNGIDGMLRSLDPHSNFHNAAEWKELLDEQRSGYTGMGASIANFELDGVNDTYILSTFPSSPASRAQLRFGDKIVAIGGEKMTGKSSDFVRDKIRGTLGTSFRLTVERSATRRIEVIEIRRNRVPQPSIPDAYILRPGIGYIALSEGFNYTTSDELDAAMRELKAQGMRSLILDLRGNGGGIVDQAVKVAEKFLPAGTLILTQRGRSRIDNRAWRSANLAPDQTPLVVLVNEETASASEIVAGAFQDDDRALIVGDKTFGKGLVQSVIDLPGRTGLTLTTGRYLTPSGRSIQRDYSKGDSYDYFNHRSATSAIDSPFFEARTLTDRKVFGGDGIQPDETVSSETLTAIQFSLLDPLFAFTRELVNGRIAGPELYRPALFSYGKKIAPGDFVVSENFLKAFIHFVETKTDGKFVNNLSRESDFIKLRLRYYIVMAAHGSVSANQVLIEDDPQVAKAVQTLPLAAQLAAKARQSNIPAGSQ